ncbi:GntR family transcriptional regulator, partial [Candidatus Latescibacterota bacterium]
MSIKLDATRPIYLQIMEEIKKRTVRGTYNPGEKLPSVRDMAKEIGVNPNTIARVYMELEREGFIETRRGQGSFITGESERVDEERRKLAGDAAEQFVREILDLELHDGHLGSLLKTISNRLSG